MRIRFKSLLAATALTALSAGSAMAEEKPTQEKKKEGANSVNINPAGLISGGYSINYERLMGSHGLLVEANYYNNSDDESESSSLGGTLGYRWHFSGQQDSGFMGLSLSYASGTGTASVNDVSYDLDVVSTAYTLNGGHRYAWDSGFNFTWRLGAGYGDYEITAAEKGKDAEAAAELLDTLLTFLPIAFEAELSVGWIF